MREILFRGKPDIDQEWLDDMETTLDEHMQSLVSVNYKDGFVFGQLVYSGKQPYIVGEVVESTDEWITLEYWIPVKPKTVGQYTGLEDVNGKKIFIGDIVKWGHLEHSRENPIRIALVIQRPGQIIFRCTSLKVKPWRDFPFGNFMYQNTERALEVIGTHWDNPELLEVE